MLQKDIRRTRIHRQAGFRDALPFPDGRRVRDRDARGLRTGADG
jgi:hypothetical protein